MSIADEYHDLEDELAGMVDYDQPVEPFADIEGADRGLRRLARHLRERDAVTSVHQAEIDRIQKRLDDRLEIIEKAISWETEGLAMFHRGALAQDPTAKTLHLPNGTLKARAQQPTWDISPEFIGWAALNAPDLLRVPAPQPDKAEIKKALKVNGAQALTADGEVVPGVTVTPREPSFTVSVDE